MQNIKKFLAVVSRLDENEMRKLVFFLDEASFTLSCNVKSQNSKFWCSENSHAIHEVSLQDLKVGALWAVTTCKIAWTI